MIAIYACGQHTEYTDFQIEQCKSILEGQKEYEIYCDISFKNNIKPCLDKLINDIKIGKIHKVICLDIETLDRYDEELFYITQFVKTA